MPRNTFPGATKLSVDATYGAEVLIRHHVDASIVVDAPPNARLTEILQHVTLEMPDRPHGARANAWVPRGTQLTVVVDNAGRITVGPGVHADLAATANGHSVVTTGDLSKGLVEAEGDAKVKLGDVADTLVATLRGDGSLTADLVRKVRARVQDRGELHVGQVDDDATVEALDRADVRCGRVRLLKLDARGGAGVRVATVLEVATVDLVTGRAELACDHCGELYVRAAEATVVQVNEVLRLLDAELRDTSRLAVAAGAFRELVLDARNHGSARVNATVDTATLTVRDEGSKIYVWRIVQSASKRWPNKRGAIEVEFEPGQPLPYPGLPRGA